MNIRAERSFKNPNGKTRRVEEHFNGFRVFFTIEGEQEKLMRVNKDELPFDADIEAIEEYVQENQDLSEYANPAIRKMAEELTAKDEELLDLWELLLEGGL